MLWLILCFVHYIRCNDVLFVATLYALATFQARDCPRGWRKLFKWIALPENAKLV